MLKINCRIHDSISIGPSQDIDPNLTVGELFARGPIELILVRIHYDIARFCVLAPQALEVQPSADTRSLASSSEAIP
jgi:hypothetical protein